jgi:hypothetical protein
MAHDENIAFFVNIDEQKGKNRKKIYDFSQEIMIFK